MLPLFFIPGAQALTAELLQMHGLDRLIPSPEARQHFSGPGGQAGILVADGSVSAERLSFKAEEQQWSPRFGMTSLIGSWKDSPPTADELVRDALVHGDELQLLDGHRWTVPRLRAWLPDDDLRFQCKLPQVMTQCPTSGKWLLEQVIPQYRDLWNESLAIAEALFDQLRSSDAAELDWEQLFTFAVKVLAVNYRIDGSVISMMQSLSPALAAQIVNVALDWSTLRAQLKNLRSRLASGGTNLRSGETLPTEASNTPTDQQSAN